MQKTIKFEGESFTLHGTQTPNGFVYMPLRADKEQHFTNGIKKTGAASTRNLSLMARMGIKDSGNEKQHKFIIK